MLPSKTLWRKAVSWIFAFFTLCYLGLNAAYANPAAINWLQANTNQDGSYWLATDIATPFQSTSEAVNALIKASPTTDNTTTIQYLSTDSYASSEYLSRKIIALKSTGGNVTPLVTALVQFQNPDGGFGELAGYDNTALDTAFALLALNKAGYSDANVIGDALGFLMQQQQADGGFPLKQPNESVVYNTAIVAMAMQRYLLTYNIADSVQRAGDFILSKKISGAGWETDWETAVSLMAISAITTDATLYKSAIDTLSASQLTNGSWNDDIYVTALAVQALSAVATVQLPADPTNGTLTGRIVDAQTETPLSGVVVTVSQVVTTESYTATTGSDGKFLLPSATPGDYEISFSIPGYLPATQTASVLAGQQSNLGLIRLTALPNAAILQGVVTDIDTGAPVSGASISITGAPTATVQTDTSGAYRVVVAPGIVTLNVTASGYQAIAATATLTANQTINFSPALVPTNGTNTTDTVDISGTVVDFESGAPLVGAYVLISGSTTHQAITDTNGKFSSTGIAAGQLSIQITAAGYKDTVLTAVIVPGNKVELGTIYMMPTELSATTTLTGTVTDNATGSPISGASISVDGASVTTDTNGQYELAGITQTNFSVFVSATGYLSSFSTINIATPTTVNADFALVTASAGGISIDSLTTDLAAYGAYQNATISLVVSNGGSYSQTIIPKLELLDGSGQRVRQLVFTDADPTGGGDNSSIVMPGGTLNKSANWYTGQLPPGDYTIHCQLFDKYTSQLLAEKLIVGTVQATQNLEKLTLKTDPQYAVVDEIAQITFSADITNKSNVDHATTLSYELSSPSGTIIHSGSKTLNIGITDVTKKFTIDNVQHTFAESGTYPLAVYVVSGAEPAQLEAIPISVAPSTRLEATQDITPNVVTPDGDKRITVNIQLRGVDVK